MTSDDRAVKRAVAAPKELPRVLHDLLSSCGSSSLSPALFCERNSERFVIEGLAATFLLLCAAADRRKNARTTWNLLRNRAMSHLLQPILRRNSGRRFSPVRGASLTSVMDRRHPA